jgi:hypothetical protein
VAWSALDAVLASKPDMYGVWLSKQSSGFCATGSQMARVHASRENRCPICGLVERAAHLNVCPSVVRTRLPTEGTELLENWLYQDGRTDRELAYWLIKYILFGGTQHMASLGPMSSFFRKILSISRQCPARCIGLRSAKTLLDGGNSWKAKSPMKLLRFGTHIVPHHLAA